MHRSFASTLFLAALLGATAPRAQSASIDESLLKPCKEDVARLCPQEKPGGGRIRDCLLAKPDQVSAVCKARLDQAQEVAAACQADAQKFCKDVPPGKGRVAVCVQQHEAELSPSCRTYLQQVRARFKEVAQACRGDAQRFCTNVPPGRGRVAVCLHEHDADLSEPCKAQLAARPAQAK